MVVFKKRTFIRVVSFTVAAFLVTCGFVLCEKKDKNHLIMQTQYVYSRNLEDLSASLNNIDITLEKVLYSASAVELGTLSAELWRESGTAKTALSQLPRAEAELESINRFLSQVGDYSLYLSKKMILGNAVTAEERENVRKMSVAAKNIANSVSEAMALYEDGYWTEEIIASLDTEYISSFGESLAEIEDTVTDYPTLIYDGPYSDHILTSVPKMTSNAAEIPFEQAREKAAEALDVPASSLEHSTDEKSKMPCYCFNTEYASISITVNGGFIADYRIFRNIPETKITYEEALDRAKEYISVQGYEFEPTYYFIDEGMCTVNFAYTDGEKIYYSDLIKVGVSMADGKILMVESRGFLSNHYERKFEKPTYTSEEAKAVLAENLTVISCKTAVIPTSGRNEKLCYEFLCRGYDEREVLVYIDAYTLQEADILILLKTDGGTMTK